MRDIDQPIKEFDPNDYWGERHPILDTLAGAVIWLIVLGIVAFMGYIFIHGAFFD